MVLIHELDMYMELFIRAEKSSKREKQVINKNRAVHHLNCFASIF
jgi:hypothetical protein